MLLKNLSSVVKTVLITLGVVGIILVVINTSAWLFLKVCILLSPNPAEPIIKYAEFPFEIVYEINGETTILNDVFVCEYDGIGMNEGVGKHRKWKGYIKSTGLESIVMCEDAERTIYFSIGNANYYMNDESFSRSKPITPDLYYTPKNPYDFRALTDNELLAHYNIKIVSWKLSYPIENSFG